MNTHKLPDHITQPYEFSVLKKSPVRKHEYKISLAANNSYYTKRRNLLVFAVLYGIIAGSIVFMLLNA